MFRRLSNTSPSSPSTTILLLSIAFLLLSFSQNTLALPSGLKLRWGWPKFPTIGYEYWGARAIPKLDIELPSGQLTGVIEGDGLFVDKAGGSFLSVGNLCNWHFSVVFKDSKGTVKEQFDSKTEEDCNHVGAAKLKISKNVPAGKGCIELYTAFTEHVASVCHNIVK